jgi:hypothetical protein
MQNKTPRSKDELAWQASANFTRFWGRAAAEQQFISDRCSQVRVARRSFQPEAQSELKLAIDWYEYRETMLGCQFALELFQL